MTTPRRLLFASMALLGVAALPAAAHRDSPEFAAARDKAFAAADADGNGVLTADEFEAFHEAMRQAFEAARFAKIDTNGDGVVSKDELGTEAAPALRWSPRQLIPGVACGGRMGR